MNYVLNAALGFGSGGLLVTLIQWAIGVSLSPLSRAWSVGCAILFLAGLFYRAPWRDTQRKKG